MNYRQQWQEQGYLVLPGVFDPQCIAQLREVCDSAYEQWKRESSPESEPDGYCYKPTAWALLHLTHPKYYKQHPEWLPRVLDAVAEPLVLTILRDIFQEEPTYTQACLYVDPPGANKSSKWHRDCQFYTPGDQAAIRRAVEEEADPPRELHMHIPLVPTAASEVVPGSHRRWDTPEENRIRLTDPKSEAMPGALRLELKPGDLAFFHVNSLHRGIYRQGVPRRTIAVTYGRVSYPRPATAEEMISRRGYIATYQPWFLKAGYLDGVRPATRAFFERFIETYRSSWKREYLAPELGSKLHAYYTDL